MASPTQPSGEDPTPTETEAPASAPEQLSGKVKETYEWWNNLATINADDPFWVGGLKILARLLGILVLLALSPLIIMGFIMAFIAAA